MIKVTCDRCGKEIDMDRAFLSVDVRPNANEDVSLLNENSLVKIKSCYGVPLHFELCPYCAKRLGQFMAGFDAQMEGGNV